MVTEMNIYHHCEESAEGRKIYCSAKSCWLGRFPMKIEIHCFSHDVYSHLRTRSDYVAQNRVKGGQTMTEKSDGILFTGSIYINKDIRCFFFSFMINGRKASNSCDIHANTRRKSPVPGCVPKARPYLSIKQNRKQEECQSDCMLSDP